MYSTIAQQICAVFFAAFVILSGCTSDSETDGEDERALFESLSPKQTNIDFENTLSERPTPHRTELLYEYFANGAGVAVGDLNGDGLDDIYFTGNMRFNRLYLNKGDMVFEDVTEQAGVSGRKNTWNTGVTMVDVNGDDLLDIYVCYSGELPLERRVDELYINQGSENGIPQFEERAEEYGLANPHSSNQAYFFDYDRDGDLDLFLLTHNVRNLPRRDLRQEQAQQSQADTVNGARFYENVGGHFEDVTGAVGINSSSRTYGLGAAISDVNKDGWPDIYVGNDYSPPDYLYINNGDGTFTNRLGEMMGHTSRASMGVDITDINNDGFSDVLVMDMLAEGNRRQKLLYIPNDRDSFEKTVEYPSHSQYMMNTFQLNNGNDTFSEIAQLSGISNTDWSWAPLAADYDNDGFKDLFVTNGILHDITNRDFMNFKRTYTMARNYDLTPEDIKKMMSRLPSSQIDNYIFRNKGGVLFEDVSSEWNMDKPLNSNGASYSDLDNDGDLDIITNNINDSASIFENNASETDSSNYLKVQLQGDRQNSSGIGSKIAVYAGGEQQFMEQYLARGYLSSVTPVRHFGLGSHERVDSLRVVWPDGSMQVLGSIAANQTVTIAEGEASGTTQEQPSPPLFSEIEPPLEFTHRMAGDVDDFDRQPLLTTPKSFGGPPLAKADVNGDGLVDVFVGGGNGQASAIFLQQADGGFARSTQPAFESDRRSNDVDALFLDSNDDGAPDLYVASGGYNDFAAGDSLLQDRLYVNDGTGTFTKRPDALPQMRTSTGAVAKTDLNDDGMADLFVGGRVVPGQYPAPPQSFVLMNDGEGSFDDQTRAFASDLQEIGMVTDAAWHDLDGSGPDELIVVGEWMPIRIFSNTGDALRDETDRFLEKEYSGLWNEVEVSDLNGDGRPDIIAGNLGLNSQIKASESEPAEIHYGDFDGDGNNDAIPSYYIEGERYPAVMLDRLRSQIPVLGSRFSSYEEYSEATLSDVLTETEIEESETLSASHMKTSVFYMNENRTLEKGSLPIEAQYSPIFEITVGDFNNDERDDLIMVGNINESRIIFGKYDANYGVLMNGSNGEKFEYVPQHKSGFHLDGDVRGSLVLGDTLMFGINKKRVVSYIQE